MADSEITKKALADALLAIAEDRLLSGITIGEICEKCYMNRKSFYYHFRDKYDLINWIFDNDISDLKNENQVWVFLTGVLDALEKRRKFYRQAFVISGHNSLKDHFEEIVLPRILSSEVCKMEDKEFICFYSAFLADAVTGAVKRWLDLKIEISPKEFSENIRKSIKNNTIFE